jgi:hypothetical protein
MEGVEAAVLWPPTHLAGKESRLCWGGLEAPPGMELVADLIFRVYLNWSAGIWACCPN